MWLQVDAQSVLTEVVCALAQSLHAAAEYHYIRVRTFTFNIVSNLLFTIIGSFNRI